MAIKEVKWNKKMAYKLSLRSGVPPCPAEDGSYSPLYTDSSYSNYGNPALSGAEGGISTGESIMSDNRLILSESTNTANVEVAYDMHCACQSIEGYLKRIIDNNEGLENNLLHIAEAIKELAEQIIDSCEDLEY